MLTQPQDFGLKAVPVPVPGILPAALRYLGEQPLIAVFWAFDDEAFKLYDGDVEQRIDPRAWDLYIRHASVRQALPKYVYAKFEEVALVFDTHIRQAYVGCIPKATRFVCLNQMRTVPFDPVTQEEVEQVREQVATILDNITPEERDDFKCRFVSEGRRYRRQLRQVLDLYLRRN